MVHASLYNVLYKRTVPVYNHGNCMMGNVTLYMYLFIYRKERSERITERIFSRLDLFRILIKGNFKGV